MQDPMTVGTQRQALLDLLVNLGPNVIGRQTVDRALRTVTHNVVKVNYRRVRRPTVMTRLLRLELDPPVPRKPLVSSYTGSNSLLVKLVVGLLVEAVLNLFNGFVFVRHSEPLPGIEPQPRL